MLNSLFSVAGLNIWITGGGSGLGRHFAHLLARHGAHVTVSGRRREPLLDVVGSIRGAGGIAKSCVLDVSQRQAAIDLAAKLRGVDVLVNNAGIVGEGAALGLDRETWDAVIATNLTGMFEMARAAATAMRERGAGGAIVNVASILGLRQAGGVTAYAVSKAGVIQTTKQLALEFARDGIRVNALAPGYVETDLNRGFLETGHGRALVSRIPQRRLGQPDELDGPLLLLASDAGSYMTGTVLVADGGHMVSTL